MKVFKILTVALLTALLCACATETEGATTEQTTALTVATTAVSTVPTDTTTAATTTTKATSTTKETSTAKETTTTKATTAKGTDVPRDIRYEYDEDGSKYAIYEYVPIAIHSDAEKVTVRTFHDTVHFREGNLFGGIQRSEVSQLPNCRVMVFEEGIEDVNWCDLYVHAPKLEILRFPAGMDTLYLMRDSNFIPESEDIWQDACIPYDPSLTGLGSTTPIGKGKFTNDKSFYNAQKLSLCYGNFITRDTLTHIEIAEGNPSYYDVDGVLFTKAGWRDYEFHLFYASVFTEHPTAVLVCFPQSHPTADGSYTVPDGTQAMLSGAFYHPKHVSTLILPDSLVYLTPTAIIATADHPIKIVCSRESAAAKYVESYGERYHLTVEYTN